MSQQILDKSFINFEVSKGTLNELDLIQTYHDFLTSHYKGYALTNAFSEVSIILAMNSLKDVEYHTVGEIVWEALPDMINELAPVGTEFGGHEGSSANIGFWPTGEVITHTIIKGSNEENRTISLIIASNIWTKLVFINENEKCSQLRNCPVNGLNDVCLGILYNTHLMSFEEALEKSKGYTWQHMAEYLVDDYRLVNWVIDNLFLDEFTASVDKLTGHQNITHLWHSIMQQESIIEGINEDGDVWSLRETCPDCQRITDLDTQEWAERDCSCDDYNELNHVWLISHPGFFDKLVERGAMTYKTDSLNLYLQTDHAGRHYDLYLREAWLVFCTATYMEQLNKPDSGRGYGN